jgi:hypothetical protein
LDTIRRGTTTWVAFAALLIASMMIGGVLLFALEEFFPILGRSVIFPVAIITIALFVFFLILRQKRVRETREVEPMPTTESEEMSLQQFGSLRRERDLADTLDGAVPHRTNGNVEWSFRTVKDKLDRFEGIHLLIERST